MHYRVVLIDADTNETLFWFECTLGTSAAFAQALQKYENEKES
jgi:hypothetical protein